MKIISEMLGSLADHWFWVLLTAACLAWYSFVTAYVGFRGFRDIRRMLKKLSGRGVGEV
jgi:hypothetical protein